VDVHLSRQDSAAAETATGIEGAVMEAAWTMAAAAARQGVSSASRCRLAATQSVTEPK
jgi:hypothetical protein